MKKQNKDSKTLLFEMMEKLNPDMKKTEINETHITKDIDFGGEEDDFLTVTLTGNCNMVDQGIGSYEFHGSRGYDSRMVPECDDITWNEDYYSEEENAAIRAYVEKNYDDLVTEIEEKFEEGGGDEPGGLDDFDYKNDR